MDNIIRQQAQECIHVAVIEGLIVVLDKLFGLLHA
jgi:hypothetical protein